MSEAVGPEPAATVIGTNLVIDYGSEEAARAALDEWVPTCIHGARMYECAEKCSYNARWHPWVVAVRYIRERRPKWASAR